MNTKIEADNSQIPLKTVKVSKKNFVQSRKFNRRKYSLSKRVLILFLVLVISILPLLIYYHVILRIPLSDLASVSTAKVKEYTTFNVCLDNADFLKDGLNKVTENMKLNDIKRFNVITLDENKDSDVTCDVVIGLTVSNNKGSSDDNEVDNSINKNDNILCSQILLPVGHLYWLKDNVNTSDLSKLNIYVPNDVSEAFVTDAFKLNGIKFKSLKVVSKNKLLSSIKDKEASSVAIIPFNNLNAQYKLLTLDKKYFLDYFRKGEFYGSIVTNLTIKGDNEFAVTLLKKRLSKNPDVLASYCQNYDNKKMSKVIMTGVTAITRSLGIKINRVKQYDWPAQKIKDFLKDADLTHVSNEISFVPGCKPVGGMRFCSDPKYIKTLEVSGVDIVELTGNHNNDYGSKYNTETIKIYKSKGWDYFGGGLNDKDAAKILYKEVNGTTIAFLGYNYYDTMLHSVAIATSSHAGANSFSYSKLKNDIQQARKKADIIIVDFQFQECYAYPSSDVIYPVCYKPLSYPDQKKVFRTAIDYGADIVIGTQAHQPQTYEIYKNKVIFYGLGNLFFDQTRWIGTRQGLILTHYFYDGKHVQTKITTTLYDKDMQTYVTTGKDRELLLKLLKQAR